MNSLLLSPAGAMNIRYRFSRCLVCSYSAQFMDLSRNGDYKLVVACRSMMLKVRERVISRTKQLIALLFHGCTPSEGTYMSLRRSFSKVSKEKTRRCNRSHASLLTSFHEAVGRSDLLHVGDECAPNNQQAQPIYCTLGV